MIESATWAHRFSHPTELIATDVLDIIVGTHGRAVAEAFVAQHRDDLSLAGDGIVEHIESWCRGGPSFDTCWDVAFGHAELALAAAADVRDTAVRVALRLTETGWAGRWGATIPPTTLRLGELALHGVERIDVDETGSRILARTRLGKVECVREADAGHWISMQADSLPVVGSTRMVPLLGASVTPPDESGEPAFAGAPPLESIESPVAEHFQASLRLLDRVGYRPLVECLLRGIVVTAKDDNTRMMSGSTSTLPGLIQISYPASLMDVTDTLVHECSHQYFHLLNRVGPFDDGTDHELYWSPPVRKNRSLSRILVAYHALANVLIFYDSVQASGIDDGGYVRRNLPTIAQQVAELDKPLRGNPALTPLGRALYEPLAEILAR